MGGEGGTQTKSAKPSPTSQVGGEGGTQAKTVKPSSTPQEQPAATPAYPDWITSFQAYYGAGVTPPPPPYFASGPTPHPYMWGGQHLMPPYGTTPPYAAVYPSGGIYGHPSVPHGAHTFTQYGVPSNGNPTDVVMTSVTQNTDPEAKSLGAKGRNSMKRVKGSLGKLEIVTSKGEGGKAAPATANGAFSQRTASFSGDSGSDGSSEGSEEGNSLNGLDTGRKRNLEPLIMNGTGAHDMNIPAGEAKLTASRGAIVSITPAAEKLAVSLPMPNLNIGMDFWNASAAGSVAPVKGRRGTAAITSTIVPTNTQLIPGRDGLPSELWVQDERELKRQRRKQSNRESARRSRLRKQAECEELTAKVDILSAENMALRNELAHVEEERKKLASSNGLLREQLRNQLGESALAEIDKLSSTKTESHFIQTESKEHFQVASKLSNSNSSQRNEQREVEVHETTSKTHLALEANAHSDTVAVG
ncbi:bZIP transcription factor 16 isoform X1 [Cryptomeria japonica]|uniref:bZIP transcription factor 16 isoform X1 n=1 Tax=Cryptomeria japonica TaxID=3369 RepID=UPI0025AC41A1|nr:bZIP transcription factor 16 isoform X1 [Cryptomeria japonica]XP_057869016.1 bZIP transcription factor 16 isoform X1 [Cryptomeria japonica]XP_057869017.1 bZIP transcription factor 16 isoform X1 [Cryptomeria japonica]XP_057869018.1 bZIP transcription factor 16 isoform X1 [Cryptomeria japonica]XP_057869019.1 bZIP transcription factor 16 isoform X1 [Cryptomeria japonica]XP_059074168.1 bZIP transcription factor 16 isoform X1 [Cryptomeria japonica]